MDQHTGNASELSRVTDQYSFVKPRPMLEVVSADANERQHVPGRHVAEQTDARLTALQRENGILPRAPGPCCLQADCLVRLFHPTGVSSNDVIAVVRLLHVAAETFP